MDLEALNPGDHRFIGEKEVIGIEPYINDSILITVPERKEIEKRWKDFVAERKSRGLETFNGELILTRKEKEWFDRKKKKTPHYRLPVLLETSRNGLFPGLRLRAGK